MICSVRISGRSVAAVQADRRTPADYLVDWVDTVERLRTTTTTADTMVERLRTTTTTADTMVERLRTTTTTADTMAVTASLTAQARCSRRCFSNSSGKCASDPFLTTTAPRLLPAGRGLFAGAFLLP